MTVRLIGDMKQTLSTQHFFQVNPHYLGLKESANYWNTSRVSILVF